MNYIAQYIVRVTVQETKVISFMKNPLYSGKTFERRHLAEFQIIFTCKVRKK